MRRSKRVLFMLGHRWGRSWDMITVQPRWGEMCILREETRRVARLWLEEESSVVINYTSAAETATGMPDFQRDEQSSRYGLASRGPKPR